MNRQWSMVRRDATRLWHRALVNGAPDPSRMRAIADGLVASHRQHRLAVLDQLVKRLKRDADERSAEIDSATPLDPDTRTALAVGLTRRYKHPMTTTFVVDRSLIGGLRIVAAGAIFEDTVKARLSALEASR